MYKLPNGQTIDQERIITLLATPRLKEKYFLDTRTGKIETEKAASQIKANALNPKITIFKDTERFFELPTVPTAERSEWMKEFIDDFAKEEDHEVAEHLLKSLLKEDPENAFLQTLQDAEDGWPGAWLSWEDFELFGILEDWLENLPIAITEEEEYCDDCPTCQAMKEGLI